MNKKSTLLAAVLAIVGIISSVALVAKFYQKPVKSAPIGRIEYKDMSEDLNLTEKELMELEAAEEQILKELEEEQEDE